MPWEGVCSPTVCLPGVGGLPGPEGVVCISPPQAYPPRGGLMGRDALSWDRDGGDVCPPPFSRLCSIQAEEKLLAPLFPQAKSRLQQWREVGWGVRVFLPLGSPLSG